MKCKTLINIIGKYNHYNILAALNLEPEQMVFIRTRRKPKAMKMLGVCLSKSFRRAILIEQVIE